MFEKINGPWTIDNLFHNRLNFKAGYGSHLNASLEVRNRLLFGETVKYFPGYSQMIGQDRGWADFSWNLASDTSFILNTSIDRVFIDLNFGKFQATIGRQRINWGMNYVWNPNDIFNAYSFFDFDYVLRPNLLAMFAITTEKSAPNKLYPAKMTPTQLPASLYPADTESPGTVFQTFCATPGVV